MRFPVPIPTIFSIIVGFIIFFQVKLRFSSKGYKNTFDDFLKTEKDANLIYKKVIDPKYFVTPNLDVLPFTKDNILDKEEKLSFLKEKIVIKKSSLKMIRFDQPVSNLELKQIFGINKFNQVVMYEEHLQMYYRALNDWAHALIKEGMKADAKKILVECIDFGSEIFLSYKLLIDIYIEENENQNLNYLKNLVSNKEFIYVNTNKAKIIDYIRNR